MTDPFAKLTTESGVTRKQSRLVGRAMSNGDTAMVAYLNNRAWRRIDTLRAAREYVSTIRKA